MPATRDGQILLEAPVSLSEPFGSLDYQMPMPEVGDPDSQTTVQEQLSSYADELNGHWVRPQPFELRYVDAPPRMAVALPELSPRLRIWRCPAGPVPADEILHSCLVTYLSGTTMLVAAAAMRRATPISTSMR